MADQSANLRVRISADVNDIKQGLALLRGQIAAVQKQASQPLPANNPVSQLGVSAGQTAAAMRQLPAQFTDIFTSLQGGMPFFTVLVQQGGQIKDSFGGIGPALKGVSSALVGVVNPLTVTAAAVAALAVAWVKGQDEAEAFARVLAETGGIAGVTGDQLVAMSEALSGRNLTQGKAAEALTQVAKSGKIVGVSFVAVASAAANMEDATGRAIGETVAEFAKLGQDPVDAIVKLNEQQSFLTEATYSQIKALQEQGRTQEASSLATETYAKVLNERANDVRASLGSIDRAWVAVTKSAKFAWDAMLDVGREESSEKKINDLSGSLIKMQELLDSMSVGDRRRGLVENRIAEIRQQMGSLQEAWIKEQKAANQKMLAAQANQAAIDQEQELLQYRSKEQRRVAEINAEQGRAREAIYAAESSGDKDLAAKIAKNRDELIKQINDKYTKETTGNTAGASRSAGLQNIKDAFTAEQAQITTSTKVLQAQYQAREVSAETYYQRLRELTERGTAAEAQSLQKQIDYLNSRNVSGKQSIDVNKQVGELEAQLAKVRTEGAAALQVLSTEEGKLKKQREDALASYKAALDASTDALQEDMDAMVARVGAGDREFEIQQRLNGVYKEQAQRLNELALQKNAGRIDEATAAAEEQAVREETDRRVQIIRDGYQSMREAQASWSNGASAAWANYVDEARNAAGQVQSAVGSALGGLEDVFVEFVTTGKLSFSDLANSIIADLARIAAKQAITGMIGAMFGQPGAGAVQRESIPLQGWDTGGFTGPGGKFEPAGIVHKGEGVLSQRDIAAIGGPQAFLASLAALRRGPGYADGGLVGGPAVPQWRQGGRPMQVQFNIENNTGTAVTAQQTGVQQDGNKMIVSMVLNAVAGDIAGGGKVAGAIQGRFDTRTRR
ncbi:phage tail tape measure protein [Xanthomonas sp. NCPPB 1638]|uniref:phage tail tape measure protein n=1 Tax=Xanthomonas TaxID=338 RepID=UPI00132F03BF|nr:phage tail tape measure protein [Xanthomonas cucurbitae]QHG87930.1 phage tail tape measure protein [Xanthomonas cucurbitae]